METTVKEDGLDNTMYIVTTIMILLSFLVLALEASSTDYIHEYETRSEILTSDYSFIRNEIQCSDDKFDKKKMIDEAMSDNKIVGYEYLKIKNAHAKCEYRQSVIWWSLDYWKYYRKIKEKKELKEEKQRIRISIQ